MGKIIVESMILEDSKLKIQDGDPIVYKGKVGVYKGKCLQLYDGNQLIRSIDYSKLTLLG